MTKNGNGKVVVLFLEKDGTGAIDQTPLTWSQSGEKASITMKYDSGTQSYEASLQGDSIVMAGGADGATSPPLARSAVGSIPSKQSIIGEWQSRSGAQDGWNGGLEFTSDGIMNMDGKRIGRYLFTDLGQLSVVSDDGKERRLGYLKSEGDGLVWHSYENQGQDLPFVRK